MAVLKLPRGFILTKKGDINPQKKSGTPPPPCTIIYWGGKGGIFKSCPRVLIWLLGVGGDVWRWLCRHMCRKISASVYWGPSGGSRVRRPGTKDPHRRERKFILVLCLICPFQLNCWTLFDMWYYLNVGLKSFTDCFASFPCIISLIQLYIGVSF